MLAITEVLNVPGKAGDCSVTVLEFSKLSEAGHIDKEDITTVADL